MTTQQPEALAADHSGDATDMVGRWYMVNKMGMATLCADKADAQQEAADAQRFWPHMGPHRAVQLVEAADVEAMRAGYAAARLEIESLRARSVEPSGEYPALPDAAGVVVEHVPVGGGWVRHYQGDSYTADQMRAFADATYALRASHGQAPAQAIGPCVICGSDEPFTGTCGSGGDPRALCKQPAPTPQADSVTAPAAGAVAHTLSDAQIEAMPVWRNFVGLWPESRREIVDAVVDLLAAAPTPPTQTADSVLEDAERLERERICAAIKAEDDYCVDHGDYMLDSDDCIEIVRGEWVRPDFSVAAARKQGGAT